MPSAKFLAQLGWFVVPEFFDSVTCASLRGEMRGAPSEPASILDDKFQMVIDAEKRRTEVVSVASETRSMVTARLMGSMPTLSAHFEVELTNFEPVSFLVYRPGAFFGRHADANHGGEAPARFRDRRVSISIFLNAESEQDLPDTYSGGTLKFSGQKRDDQKDEYSGIAVKGEAGLLIAFQSSWLHEIQPVRRGVRYSIVTWFF